jgi:hypothetical protein
MTRVLTAWCDGFHRVAHVPAIVVGVLLITMATAAPLTLAMRDLLQRTLGRSLVAESLTSGFDLDWWQEFAAQAGAFGTTFSPNLIGFAVTLDNLGDFLDSKTPIAPIVTAVAVFLGMWVFLTGGIIDRYARQRPTRSAGFFSACGIFSFRFLRLTVVAAPAYWWLFTYVHGWLFDDWLGWLTADLAVEQVTFYWRVLMYVIFAALLAVVNIVIDYAKIRAVVEDRRSMLGALFASIGFVVRHPGRVFGLYMFNALTFLVLIAIWATIAPGTGGLGASVWAGLAIGQLYILARLVLKLQFLASQIALFQASLAHATYTAVPEPKWPDSPAAELIHSGS